MQRWRHDRSFQNSYYYYYYYAAFNAPCVGHKADESQARGYVDLRVAVSVIKRFKFLKVMSFITWKLQ